MSFSYCLITVYKIYNYLRFYTSNPGNFQQRLMCMLRQWSVRKVLNRTSQTHPIQVIIHERQQSTMTRNTRKKRLALYFCRHPIRSCIHACGVFTVIALIAASTFCPVRHGKIFNPQKRLTLSSSTTSTIATASPPSKQTTDAIRRNCVTPSPIFTISSTEDESSGCDGVDKQLVADGEERQNDRENARGIHENDKRSRRFPAPDVLHQTGIFYDSKLASDDAEPEGNISGGMERNARLSVKRKKTYSPVVAVVEEHHDVIPYWFSGVNAGLLHRHGNVLVHIDAHPDTSLPLVNSSFPLFRYPHESDLTYLMQRNDMFIAGAALTGLFGRFIWIVPPWDKKLNAVLGDQGYSRFYLSAGLASTRARRRESKRSSRKASNDKAQGVAEEAGPANQCSDDGSKQAGDSTRTRDNGIGNPYRRKGREASPKPGEEDSTNVRSNKVTVGSYRPHDVQISQQPDTKEVYDNGAGYPNETTKLCYCVDIDREGKDNATPSSLCYIYSSGGHSISSTENPTGKRISRNSCSVNLYVLAEIVTEAKALKLLQAREEPLSSYDINVSSPGDVLAGRDRSGNEEIEARTVNFNNSADAEEELAKSKPDLFVEQKYKSSPWLNEVDSVILDIDEDYYGVEPAFTPLKKAKVALSVATALSRKISQIFCPANAHQEALADNIFYNLLNAMRKDLSHCRLNAKTCQASELRLEKFSVRLRTSIEEGGAVGLMCGEGVHDVILTTGALVEMLLPLKDKQLKALQHVGICLRQSPNTMGFQSWLGMVLCIGYNRPGNSVVEFHVPDKGEISKRSAALLRLLKTSRMIPKQVTIARSVRDGYTPRGSARRIEKDVLNILRNVYPNAHNSPIIYDDNLLGGQDGWAGRHSA